MVFKRLKQHTITSLWTCNILTLHTWCHPSQKLQHSKQVLLAEGPVQATSFTKLELHDSPCSLWLGAYP